MQTSGELLSYTTHFVQRLPCHGVKRPGEAWRTVRRPLSDNLVREHLAGELAVASLPRYYPVAAALDVDGRPLAYAEALREELGLGDSTSLLCRSESDDSWHVMFRPTYRARPPTVRLLRDVMQPWASAHGVEAYPQPDRLFRLPFGPRQTVVGREAEAWEERLADFRRLEEYDIGRVPAQGYLDFGTQRTGRVPVAAQGRELFEHGLQAPHSRHDAEWKVLYWLWRQNVDFDSAVEAAWRWLCQKHNGYSEDMRTNPRAVHAELRRQAAWLWSRYELPDSTHNEHFGWVARPDLPELLRIAEGSLPRARFLFGLVRYCNPRSGQARVRVHRDVFRLWAHGSAYLTRLGELEDAGLVRRDTYWVPRVRSKSLVLRWEYRGFEEAVLYDGRAPDSLEETLLQAYPADDVRALLVASGARSDLASRWVTRWVREAAESSTKCKGLYNSPASESSTKRTRLYNSPPPHALPLTGSMDKALQGLSGQGESLPDTEKTDARPVYESGRPADALGGRP